MKKVMLVNFGFERWPAEDFSDDGNRFTCYKAGNRVRISKLVCDGWAYIDGSIRDYTLPYDVYSKLPHYAAVSKLNGISLEALTDEMLDQLYLDCIDYEREYDEALATLVYPTEAELRAKCVVVQSKTYNELARIEERIKNNFITIVAKLRPHEWSEIKTNVEKLLAKLAKHDPDTLIATILNTITSISFCKTVEADTCESWYFTRTMELIDKALS